MSETQTAKPLNTQLYKLAATGAGVIVCQPISPTSFRSLLSRRAAQVGSGFGITGGGFVENGAIYAKSPGFMVETVAEAWRETVEENPGFEIVFPLDVFIERAQSIATLHVRVDDENGVHGTNYFVLTVTDIEWNRVAQLRAGEEREGELLEVVCNFDSMPFLRVDAQRHISLYEKLSGPLSFDAFFHQHEVRALAQIAWHVQKGRLWSSQ